MATPQVPDEIRDHIRDHYEYHKQTYAKVWDRLHQAQRKYQTVSYSGKRAMLQLSYINSVLTQRRPYHSYEEALERFMAGDSVKQALKGAGGGYHNQHSKWIQSGLEQMDMWNSVVDMLANGQNTAAHDLLSEEATGLKHVKGAFTLSNLGFTQFMCLDGNLKTLLAIQGIDPSSADEYEHVCGSVRELFPELSTVLDPAELQWLIWDYQRFFRVRKSGEAQDAVMGEMVVARHYTWFDAIEKPIHEIRARVAAENPATPP